MSTPQRQVPTSHVPRTPGKIEVLRLRLLRGEPLFSPDDAALAFDQGLAVVTNRNGKDARVTGAVSLKKAA